MKNHFQTSVSHTTVPCFQYMYECALPAGYQRYHACKSLDFPECQSCPHKLSSQLCHYTVGMDNATTACVHTTFVEKKVPQASAK